MDQSFEQMTPAERILYVQDLWDRITERPEEVAVNPGQLEELRRRLEAHRSNPGESVPWEIAREQMRQRR